MTEATMNEVEESTEVSAELKARTALLILEELLPNEEVFEKFFKAKNTTPVDLGAGNWGYEPTKNIFGMVTPNGSVISLKFYDAIKKIFDVKNQEVPGRESWIAYVEVTVRPAGKKPYMFKAFGSQQVWANGHLTAKVKHEAAKAKLVEKFAPLGFTVGEGQWDERFDRIG